MAKRCKVCDEFGLLGAPRGAQKSVVSPVPSSSSCFQLDHHSRMSVFSDKRKEILSGNVRIQEGCCPSRISKSKQRGSEAKIGARMAAVATQNRLLSCVGPESSFTDRGLDSAVHRPNRRRSLGTLFP